MRRQPPTRHGRGNHPRLLRRVGQQLGEKGSLSERRVSEREAQPDGEGAQVSRSGLEMSTVAKLTLSSVAGGGFASTATS